MARTLRNLKVSLGIVFSERGLASVEKKLERLDKRLERVDKIARTGAGLTALAGAATSLGAAVAPAAGAVVALPAALALVKTATATAKLALVGMGEAMEAIASGDAAELDEALTKLSPSARKFVREADRMFGSLKSIQQSVQDRAFASLDRELRPVADNLLPDLQAGALAVATGFNAAAREAAGFAKTPMARGVVNQVFASTARVMGMLSTATRPALALVSQLTVKGLPLAERMASWAVNGVKAAAGFATSARGAAFLERTVDRAGDTLAQLGRIGGNAVRGVVSVLANAKSSGDGLLDTIEQLTARFAAWARSAEGQREAAETLRLVRDMAAAVAQVLPLVLTPFTALIKLINGLPGPLRNGVIQFLAIAVVVGSLTARLRPLISAIGAVGTVVRTAGDKVAVFSERVGGVSGMATKARAGLANMTSALGGPWGIALAAAAAAIGFFAIRNAEAEARVQQLTDALIASKGALDGNLISTVKMRLENDGAYRAAQRLGVSLQDVTDAALGTSAAMDRVNAAVRANQGAYTDAGRAGAAFVFLSGKNAAAAEVLGGAVGGANTDLRDAQASMKRIESASPGMVGATQNVAKGMDGVGSSAGKAGSKIDALTMKMNRFKSLAGDADLAAIAFRDSLDGLSEAFGKNNIRIDAQTGKIKINTKVGREANRVLIETIQSAVEHADKVHKQTGSVLKANVAFGKHINVLRGVLEKSGLSKTAIDRLISRYTTAPGAINAALNKIKNKTVTIKVQANGTVTMPGGTKASLWAKGGVLPGYTPGRDPHMFYSPTGGMLGLSGGEAVMRPEWTKAIGTANVDRMNAAARSGGVAGVKKVLADGVGPQRLGGEGAFFADGGIIARGSLDNVGKIAPAMARYNRKVGEAAWKAAQKIAKKLTELGLGGPGVQKALAWARRQAGKPYRWGGVGPGGYDCSGFTSAILNVIQGRNPYSRRHTTHSFGASGGPDGFVRNRNSGFRVGVTDAGVGHMAGTLGRVAVESSGSAGVRVGGGARGADNGLFTRRYGLTKFDQGGLLPPGYTPVYNGTGRPEYVFTQRQMQQGGVGETHVHVTVQVPPTVNRHEVAKEIYDVLAPYMQRSKRKLPS